MDRLTDFLTARDSAAKKDYLVLLLLFGSAFFAFLGRIPLLDPDEGRYAEIPREMLERGDFVTPFLNYVKYFEKPPLHYWLDAASFSLFGHNEFAARFPAALAGLLCVLLTYHVGRTIFGRRTGLFAAMVLGASAGFLVQGRLNIIDMTLTFCMTGTLSMFVLASREGERHKRLHYYAFYAFSALTVLAKGLIGLVLPGGVIVVYIVLTRKWKILREMRLFTGIILFLAIASPWFILVSMRNPEFARFFFIHEHFERFLTKVHGRYQPFWFFVPVLLGCMFPWSFFIPSAFGRWWRMRRGANGDERLYLVIWALLIFVFFSLSDSKLVPYILPVFPPLALLVGDLFAEAPDTPWKPLKLPAWVLAGILAILGIGLPIYAKSASKPAVTIAASAVIAVICLSGAAATTIAARRASALHLLAGLLLFSLLFETIAPRFFLEGVSRKKSNRTFARAALAESGPGTVLASTKVAQGLSFYTKRRILLVNDRNELEFGSRLGDNSQWFMDLPKFLPIWEGRNKVILLLQTQELPGFRALTKTPVRELACEGKRTLVTNR